MSLTIRIATANDAAIVHRFVQDLAEYEREPEAVEATVESLRTDMALSPPPFECLIAEYDGIAAGFALFFHNYSTWKGRPGIWLEDLFVSPVLRRKGIGLALLRAVARIANERKCARLEWAVLDWNRPAIDFYQSLGAVPQSEWTIFRLTGPVIAELGGATS